MKKSFKYYSLNVRKPVEINTTPSSYNSMSWGCPGIPKSRCGMDVVSKSWEYITIMFRVYIPIGSRDILIKNFET